MCLTLTSMDVNAFVQSLLNVTLMHMSVFLSPQATPTPQKQMQEQRRGSRLALSWNVASVVSRGSMAGVSSVPSTSPRWVLVCG